MCFGKDTENAKFYFDRKNYVNCKAEKYYADYCHRRRSFIWYHIKEMCKKASQNLAALSCIKNRGKNFQFHDKTSLYIAFSMDALF